MNIQQGTKLKSHGVVVQSIPDSLALNVVVTYSMHSKNHPPPKENDRFPKLTLAMNNSVQAA